MERFRNLRDNDQYDAEKGCWRIPKSTTSRGLIALLLIAFIVAAVLFGGIVLLWMSKENSGQVWAGKLGRGGRLVVSEANNNRAVMRPVIEG